MNNLLATNTPRLLLIGLDAESIDGDLQIRLRDTANPRGEWIVPLDTALSAADQIDIVGLQRMASALSVAARSGSLCAEDLTAWRASEMQVLSIIAARGHSSIH